MAGTPGPICCCEGSALIPSSGATCLPSSGRARERHTLTDVLPALWNIFLEELEPLEKLNYMQHSSGGFFQVHTHAHFPKQSHTFLEVLTHKDQIEYEYSADIVYDRAYDPEADVRGKGKRWSRTRDAGYAQSVTGYSLKKKERKTEKMWNVRGGDGLGRERGAGGGDNGAIRPSAASLVQSRSKDLKVVKAYAESSRRGGIVPDLSRARAQVSKNFPSVCEVEAWKDVASVRILAFVVVVTLHAKEKDISRMQCQRKEICAGNRGGGVEQGPSGILGASDLLGDGGEGVGGGGRRALQGFIVDKSRRSPFSRDATHILTGGLAPVYRVSVTVTMSELLLPCAARSSTTISGPLQASLEASPCEHRQVCRREYRCLKMLDVWPALPVVISQPVASWEPSNWIWENLVGALESKHRHRICKINLPRIPTSEWERLATAMRKPFPELTFLRLWVPKNTATSLPDPFLGGSAPLLRYLWLANCPFPGIPKLLLSSNQLVLLDLWQIPDSGYISPQDLVTALSVLSRLEDLYLGFRSPLYPARRRPRPLTRSVLPALRELVFKGVHGYLEDLLAQIEAPLLTTLYVTFFMDIDFVLPQLHRLISQVESFNSCDRATVRTSDSAIRFTISRKPNRFPVLALQIICRELDSQLASLAQLNITDDASQSHWKVDIETTQWLELLAPFTAMKNLGLTHQAAPHVCQALEELTGERVIEILPALQNIFLEGLEPLGSVPKYIEGFAAARKLSGHPVAVHCREEELGRIDEFFRLPI
ncbi:hypothetical protein F5148DRAFT_1371515 [Russula earlei]|uniref:Uncharacterized protein n=1 Tax=Russula earlei TaxID=71964 RepID=A0ACC0TTJ7_9AGAM|nr:hypothetical protein F5148DRAFT_1371515 [Russula earlei]